jgi:hypothetical protein
VKSPKFRLSALVAALALGACASASAASVSLNATGLSSNYLADGVYSGQFDGSSLLPAQFRVNSASFSFSFSDDVDSLMQQAYSNLGSTDSGYGYVGGQYNPAIGGISYVFERAVHQYYSQQLAEAGESVKVQLGATNVAAGQGATATTTSYAETEISAGRSLESYSFYPGYTYSCGNFCSAYHAPEEYSFYLNNFDNVATTTVHANGAFVVSGTVTNTSLIQELIDTRALGFSLNVAGDLMLTSGRLDLDVTQVSAVPEPDTMLLMLGGLGAVGYAARRRRKPV